jgi:hypothetical protein
LAARRAYYYDRLVSDQRLPYNGSHLHQRKLISGPNQIEGFQVVVHPLSSFLAMDCKLTVKPNCYLTFQAVHGQVSPQNKTLLVPDVDFIRYTTRHVAVFHSDQTQDFFLMLLHFLQLHFL